MQTRLHLWRTSTFGVVVLGVVSLACAEASAPAELNSRATATHGVALASNTSPIPAWVLHPTNFPPGLKGTNNCTFGSVLNVPNWNFHADAGCWERPGPDGWVRQQQHKIHVPALAECNGGAGDVSPIRICKAAGLENPCPINPTTGPNGCAQCVRSFSCH